MDISSYRMLVISVKENPCEREVLCNRDSYDVLGNLICVGLRLLEVQPLRFFFGPPFQL